MEIIQNFLLGNSSIFKKNKNNSNESVTLHFPTPPPPTPPKKKKKKNKKKKKKKKKKKFTFIVPINPFQPSDAFHLETFHFFCRAKFLKNDMRLSKIAKKQIVPCSAFEQDNA